ncbi:hypothetical protein NE237_027473 [Protea cynaroides]|uniref:Uncharacterized protein n=1 Tax=Protea cynaroides TaxID=273540 RepID=A0A9Q0JT11_9MAGN|nr:hypothetical protein NE237_027473 [Protea cynaroides]
MNPSHQSIPAKPVSKHLTGRSVPKSTTSQEEQGWTKAIQRQGSSISNNSSKMENLIPREVIRSLILFGNSRSSKKSLRLRLFFFPLNIHTQKVTVQLEPNPGLKSKVVPDYLRVTEESL